MEAGLGIDTDPEEASSSRGKIVNGFVTAGNWEAVDEGDGVQQAVRDTETPDEVIDIGDVLLVGLGGQDDHGEPAAESSITGDPADFDKVVQLCLHDLGFVDTVPGLSTGNRSRVASVNAELVVEDGTRNARRSEGVPVSGDDVG